MPSPSCVCGGGGIDAARAVSRSGATQPCRLRFVASGALHGAVVRITSFNIDRRARSAPLSGRALLIAPRRQSFLIIHYSLKTQRDPYKYARNITTRGRGWCRAPQNATIIRYAHLPTNTYRYRYTVSQFRILVCFPLARSLLKWQSTINAAAVRVDAFKFLRPPARSA